MGRIREVVTVAEILTEKVNKALLRYINLPSKQEKIFPVRLTPKMIKEVVTSIF
jgi:hypothetical protein